MQAADLIRIITDATRLAAPQIANIAMAAVATKADHADTSRKIDAAVASVVNASLCNQAMALTNLNPCHVAEVVYIADVDECLKTHREFIERDLWDKIHAQLRSGLIIDMPVAGLPGCTIHAVFRSVIGVTYGNDKKHLVAASILCHPSVPFRGGPLAVAGKKLVDSAARSKRRTDPTNPNPKAPRGSDSDTVVSKSHVAIRAPMVPASSSSSAESSTHPALPSPPSSSAAAAEVPTFVYSESEQHGF